MRLASALTLLVLLAACGGDAPEPPADEPPEEQERAPSRPVPAEQPEQGRSPASPASEPTRSESTADRALYTVQVAAFTSAVSARELAAGLRGEDMPVWTSIVELEGRTFHRVRVGALSSLTAAYRLGDLITARHGWPVWVAPVTPGDRIPPNAVQRTREQLRVQGG